MEEPKKTRFFVCHCLGAWDWWSGRNQDTRDNRHVRQQRETLRCDASVPDVVRRPRPWDPRDPAAVEPLLCPSMFQDLAEPEPLETDVAFVSIWHIRAVRMLTFSVRGVGVLFQYCKRRHLGNKGIDGLFDTGNSGGDNSHSFTNGLHVVVDICESSREW